MQVVQRREGATANHPDDCVLAAEQLALDLINLERRQRGLRPYLHMGQLTPVCREHSGDMAQWGYCSHFSPEGLGPSSRLARRGLGYRAFGENASLFRLPEEPEAAELEAVVREAQAGFMNSPGHRRAILEPKLFSHTAVGLAVAGNRVGITEMFITPRRLSSESRLRRFLHMVRLVLGWR